MIRVLVVDDSALVRKLVAGALSRDPGIEVIATAPDPYTARDLIVQLEPDVVTLDIKMPRMDGVSFLKKLMHYHPLPVVMVSSIVQAGCALALEALEAGAVDVVATPPPDQLSSTTYLELIEKVKAAAGARPGAGRGGREALPRGSVRWSSSRVSKRIIAIGASTGGTEALKEILTRFPENAPAALIVQHMPEGFTKAFAERLDDQCSITVREAEDGVPVVAGQALIAPGNRHMLLRRMGEEYRVHVKVGPLVCRHRPSAEVLFRSVAGTAGADSVGVLLTGMGRDGAAGMRELREAGAETIAQDEASCVVFGMPKEAISLGGVEHVVPLHGICDKILACAQGPTRAEKVHR